MELPALEVALAGHAVQTSEAPLRPLLYVLAMQVHVVLPAVDVARAGQTEQTRAPPVRPLP